MTLLDSINRPETSDKPIQYVIKPTNDVIRITPGNTFLPVTLSRNQFTPNQNTTTIITEPVGVDANPSLVSSAQFDLVQTSSTLMVTTALPEITGFTSENPIGTVQLVDQYGNPDPAQDDITVNLSSNSTNSQVPSSITIPKGSSFAEFSIITNAKKVENDGIIASANGFKDSQTTLKVKPVLPKLIIKADTTHIDLNTQVGINLYIKDEFGDPASNVDLSITPSANSTVTPDTVKTGDDGIAGFFVKTSQGPQVSL
ncbi:hypothetical protein, partial [Candidatus Nitrosotalea sp. FS]|uniref:hypothetical protein n=1 Tax=Candidatus Nitrosotalea sp. FS TaxID=2341021 RepID=UPI00140B9F68